jgi:hypothetical protein
MDFLSVYDERRNQMESISGRKIPMLQPVQFLDLDRLQLREFLPCLFDQSVRFPAMS